MCCDDDGKYDDEDDVADYVADDDNNDRGLSLMTPLPSDRRHRSNGDCLEGKRENYQVCSVQYCVHQLYTVNCTHMNRLTVLWIGFCLTGPISLCLGSVLCMYYFVCYCILHARVVL